MKPGLWRANSAISASICPDSLQPAFVKRIAGRQAREQVPQPLVGDRHEPLGSDGIPMIACAIQSVTISASVILLLAFPARLGRKSSARQ